MEQHNTPRSAASSAGPLSTRDADKAQAITLGRRLVGFWFRLVATAGTAAILDDAGLPVDRVNKVREGRPNCVDAILSNQIHLVVNTTDGGPATADSYSIRRSALTQHVPYYTTIAGAAAVDAIAALADGNLEVAPLQSYL